MTAQGWRFLWHSIVAVATKEMRQTFRDPRMTGILFVAPVMQLMLLGYAVDLDVDQVATAVVDQDQTPQSRDLLAHMLADDTLKRTVIADDPAQALGSGAVNVALVVPQGYAEDLMKGRTVQIQVLIDGTDPVRAQAALTAAQEFLQRESLSLAKSRIQRVAQLRGQRPKPATISVLPRILYNPLLRSPMYMVPGVAAVVLLIVTTVVTAMSIAKEKELGTIEQILVTPMQPIALLVGKVIPFALVGMITAGVVLAVGTHLFDVPIRGSVPTLILGTALYLLSTLGAGVFISTVAANQQQAILGSFFFLMPAILLSGFMSPLENMPGWIQIIASVNPVRYYVQLLRAVMLKGAGAADLVTPLAALAVFGVSIVSAGALRFRKTIR